MKRKNALNFIMIGMLALSMTSCGGGNDAGGSAAAPPVQENQSVGATPGAIVSADDLANALANKNFTQQSVPGAYKFQKESGFVNNSCWFGDYKGNEDDKIGIRLLGSDGSIQRTVDLMMCGSDRVTFTFSEDASHGNTIDELANFLATKVNEAKAQHSEYNVKIKKVVNGGLYNYIAPDADCYGNSMCETIKSSDSKTWDVYYEGGWKRIDLNGALIQQPTLR